MCLPDCRLEELIPPPTCEYIAWLHRLAQLDRERSTDLLGDLVDAFYQGAMRRSHAMTRRRKPSTRRPSAEPEPVYVVIDAWIPVDDPALLDLLPVCTCSVCTAQDQP
ncbi:MAG TPA: hypothetical protein VKG45_04870 [Actinomycetes bacterium]|nr:hypothetical protein [Actinomycetes bacterium]